MIKIDWNPPENQLRQFGWIALFGFPLLAFVFTRQLFEAPDWAFWTVLALGPLTLVLALADPKLVRPIYLGLMVIALPIGIVISFVLLALIYYTLFLFVGLLFRLLGKDPLEKRIDRSAKSYWIERPGARPAPSYLRLY